MDKILELIEAIAKEEDIGKRLLLLDELRTASTSLLAENKQNGERITLLEEDIKKQKETNMELWLRVDTTGGSSKPNQTQPTSPALTFTSDNMDKFFN